MKKALQYIPLVLIILLMSMPALQMWSGLFREKPLNGAFILADEPDFSRLK